MRSGLLQFVTGMNKISTEIQMDKNMLPMRYSKFHLQLIELLLPVGSQIFK